MLFISFRIYNKSALLIVALLIGFHHFVITGKLYGLNNVLLHEFFMALFGGIGIGVLIAETMKTDR